MSALRARRRGYFLAVSILSTKYRSHCAQGEMIDDERSPQGFAPARNTGWLDEASAPKAHLLALTVQGIKGAHRRCEAHSTKPSIFLDQAI